MRSAETDRTAGTRRPSSALRLRSALSAPPTWTCTSCASWGAACCNLAAARWAAGALALLWLLVLPAGSDRSLSSVSELCPAARVGAAAGRFGRRPRRGAQP